ncbi:MAG: glycosyltransferase family 8 protein [Candidatus Falkowbacteria bacterium]|nr:glycosyltransferase family 8 protein [Candidatus Falkowbacteria bacterium]
MFEFKNEINLVLAADDNYAPPLGVALISIIENYHDSRFLFFHILDNGISDKNKEYLKIIGKKKGVELIFYDIPENLLADCPEVNHLSRTSYARLMISELLPSDVDKALYLDADIVVLENIAELYDQDLNGLSLGAVADVMAKEILRIYFYSGLSNYFNAGVLLINLDSWRRQDVKKKSLEFISRHFKDIIRADQDILNCLFKDDWKLLDNRFNTDLKRRGRKAMPGRGTVVLHYSDRVKPWQYLFSGASGRYYFDYLRKTPWPDFKFGDKNFKNFFKKYYLLLVKEFKKFLLPYLPTSLSDNYRRLLWRTYRMKK